MNGQMEFLLLKSENVLNQKHQIENGSSLIEPLMQFELKT